MTGQTVGELCDFISGLWKGEKPPFVRVNVYRNTNFNKDGTLDDSDVAELDVEARQYAKRKLQYGDIILEKSGGGPKQPVGRVALFDKESGEYSLSNFTSALRIRDPKRLGFAYLHRFLFWQHLAGVTESMQKRSTGIRNLNGDAYKAIKVPLPPLPEQQRIVGILDEAFAGIAAAKANAEKNLRNARALFESHLQRAFAEEWKSRDLVTLSSLATDITDGDHLPPPKSATGVPFITIGNIIKDTRTIDFGDAFMVPRHYFNSLKPNKRPRKGDVLYTVTGSFGIPVIVENDTEFCFQRHIGLIRPNAETNSRWLYYLLLSPQVLAQADDKATGTAQRTVSLKVLRAYTVPRVPMRQQCTAVAKLDALSAETQRLESLYQQRLAALDALKKSLLHQAFTAQLAADRSSQSVSAVIPFPFAIPNITTTDLHAGILAMACKQHEAAGKLERFTHVKAEKISHMVEARIGIDLGRKPVKDAAGPNDFPHLHKVEHRARMANFFDFKQVAGGAYRVQKLRGFNRLIDKTRTALGERLGDVEGLLQWMLPMNVRQAEIVATVFAAWNNLLLDGKQSTEEEIVHESRENWHPDKLKIERWRFFKAVEWLREKGVVPEGKGKRVVPKAT